MALTPNRTPRDTVLEDLPFYLARAALAFRRLNDRTLHAVGLKAQAAGSASILHILKERDDCTINQLVECTHLPNGTLTGLLDVLEHGHLVERIRNPKDGRSWIIRLTKRGRTICTKLERRHRLVMNLFTDVFSETESRELKRLLDRITVRMRDYRPEPSVSHLAS